MHELWLCRSILEIIEQNARAKKCTRVRKVVLEIGELIAVEKNSLIFSFNVITTGTIAENATLQIIEVPGEAQCGSCQKKVPLRHYYDECQRCGSRLLKVTQGEELRVKSMEVE